MKIRIRGNSVRIRLTRSEVARLGEGHSVEQTTQFSNHAILKSLVEPSAGASAPLAEFNNGQVAVRLPPQLVRQWAYSDDVTIEGKQPIDAGQFLQILVEKDFECIHSRAEGDTDRFPNPRQ